MCEPVTIGIIGLSLSARLGTGFGIVQAQQSAQMQAAQAQQQLDWLIVNGPNRHNWPTNQPSCNSRERLRLSRPPSSPTTRTSTTSTQAANKTYVQEQAKLKEARDKAAFKSVDILTKSIGTQGKSSPLGPLVSVGLLALDAERKAGQAQAQQNASIGSAEFQSAITQDIAFDQAKSAANQAFSRIQAPTQAPILDPYGMQGLVIPT